MSRSAGDHEYRQIQVTLTPLAGRVQVSVHARRKRGTDLVWLRRLLADSVDLPEDESLVTTSAVLRLCGERLLALAEATDR